MVRAAQDQGDDDTRFSLSGRGIGYLLTYSASHREEIDPEARRLAKILRRYYPAGLELPVVAAMFALSVSLAVDLKGDES